METQNQEGMTTQELANSDEFWPEDVEVQEGGGGFLKLQSGENRIRILTNPLHGFLVWDRKKDGQECHRARRGDAEAIAELQLIAKRQEKSKDRRVKQFAVMAVWDYSDDKLKVWELTQPTIMKPLIETSRENGNPADPKTGYGIKITRKGEGMKTEYTLVASRKDLPLTNEQSEALKKVKVDNIFTDDSVFLDDEGKPQAQEEGADGWDDEEDIPF